MRPWLAPLLIVALFGAAVRAAPEDGGTYEDRWVAHALEARHRTVDPSPEGKRIGSIEIVTTPVVAEGDPWPRLLNVVHVTTRHKVVRRELLFKEGEPYQVALAEETERNLRKLFILNLVRVVPLEASDGTVDVLVLTKDLWSIRDNTEYLLVGPLLEYLRLHPTEENFLGYGKELSAELELRLDTLAIGQGYWDPRLFGTRLSLEEDVAVVFRRSGGVAEGSRGELGVLRRFVQLADPHAYYVDGAWNVGRSRVHRGADVWELPVPSGGTVPYEYDHRLFALEAMHLWRFGERLKVDLGTGGGAYTKRYSVPAFIDDEAARAYLAATRLPRTEDAVYADARLFLFTPNYVAFRELRTFAFTESYQVGPLAQLTLRGANPGGLVGPTYAELGAAARYRGAYLDDLFWIAGAAHVRYMPAVAIEEKSAWVNRRAALELANISPFVGPGRFVLRGMADVRGFDLNRGLVFLGGEDGLRGESPQALAGTKLVLFNAEYRTRPFELLTLHTGAVFFWDAGSAFDRAPNFVHTVGAGLRILLPQFDVQPIRIDFGFVLNAENPPPLDRFSSSFGQVLDYRPSLLDAPIDGLVIEDTR